MRNLKKFLALVLALMMVVSVMVTVSATSFKDDAKISAKYEEAVEVLAGLKVLQGNVSGNLMPQQEIKRSEMAAIAYRITTGDPTTTNPGVYTGSRFSDVPSNHWAYGFINWCADGGLLAGYPDGTFKPDDTITGYDVITILLRALGYGRAGELTGAGYETNAATLAQELGLIQNIGLANLGKPATREMVAEMTFQTLKANVVTYTVLGGYYEGRTPTNLGKKEFGLAKGNNTQDDLGRPYYTWTSYGDPIAEIAIEPVAEYTTPVSECDVYDDVCGKSGSSFTAGVKTNGKDGANYEANVLTVHAVGNAVIGAQGRWTGVYHYDADNDGTTLEYRVVYIDTWLARVDKVENATFDAAGHLDKDSKLTMTIYANGSVNGTTSPFSWYVTNGSVNYDYAVGDYILVNYATTTKDTNTPKGTSPKAASLEIVGKAVSTVGAQSVVYSDKSRTVGGTKYASALKFFHDATNGNVGSTNYTWYFDQYGNIIGSFAIDAVYSYGVIKQIQWINEDGDGYAKAILVLMDGTETTVKVDNINGHATTYRTDGSAPGYLASDGVWVVSTYASENKAAYTGTTEAYTNYTKLMAISDLGDGYVALNPKAGLNWTASTTVTKGNATLATTKVDGDTTFLVRTTDSLGNYVYTVYHGFENVPNMTGGVDWIDLDGDNFADYVYVIGNPAASTANGLVYVKSTANYYDNNTRTYVLTDAYVEGVQTDVRVADLADYAAKTLYWVSYTGGVVANGGNTAVAGDATALGSTGNSAQLITVQRVRNGVIEDDTNTWVTTGATVYGGTVTVGSQVVVVFKTSTTSVSAIYVI